MNGPDHYHEAERLLEEAESCQEPGSRALWCLELARLHAALAQVAATALNADGREWAEVAGRHFGSMRSISTGKAGPIAEAAPTSSPGPVSADQYPAAEEPIGQGGLLRY